MQQEAKRMERTVLMLKVFAVIELVLLIVHPCAHGLSRDQFPPDFVFGASTSAYQVLLSPFLSSFTLFTVIVFSFLLNLLSYLMNFVKG